MYQETNLGNSMTVDVDKTLADLDFPIEVPDDSSVQDAVVTGVDRGRNNASFMARLAAIFKTPKRPVNPVFKDLATLALRVITIAAAFTLVFTVVYGFDRNTDPGMSPSIKDGDLVLFYRFATSYKAGDLVVLNYQGKQEVRRVVATGGDIVDITNDGLVINGSLQGEPEITQPTRPYAEGITFPTRVGDQQVFVLGDARQNATDSRVYGSVDIKNISGKVITMLRWRSL